MKKLIALLALASLTTACTKKPDDPSPATTTATSTSGTTTTTLPPVTNCQGATVFYTSTLQTMPDNPVPNQASYVVPNYETSCGDTLTVLFKQHGAGPAVPWTTMQDFNNGATYYDLTNQTVTAHNSTGQSIDLEIQATLN